MHEKLYEHVRARLYVNFSCGYTYIHGSDILEWVMMFYHGSATGDSHTAETIIRRLVADEILEPLECAPTLSQRAFAGLQYSRKGYKRAVQRFDCAYGLQTHFKFRIHIK